MHKNQELLVQNENVLIEVKNLFGVYNEFKESQFVSLTDVNFQFKEQKIYFIIGNSGCGKSTLVSHLNGLLVSNYGAIKIEDRYQISKKIFLQDELLGILSLNELEKFHFLSSQVKIFKNHNADKQIFILAFRSDVSYHLVRILFEAYYKVAVHKVQKLYSQEIKQFLYLVAVKSDEYELSIPNALSLEDLKQYPINKKNKLHSVCEKLALTLKIKLGSKKIKKVKKIRKNVSMVFQFPEYQIFKDTIMKDVTFGPLALGVDKKTAYERAKYYLTELSIPENYFERSPFGLSGGQKRRVALAGILSIDPKVLIFDEPTAGLDPVGEEEMISLVLKAKARGQTVIVITHTMDHVLRAADEVIVMNEGEIIKTGTPYEIFRDEELLKTTSIDRPKVIETIHKLTLENQKFEKLYDYEPRTVEELADSITDFFNGLKGGLKNE